MEALLTLPARFMSVNSEFEQEIDLDRWRLLVASAVCSLLPTLHWAPAREFRALYGTNSLNTNAWQPRGCGGKDRPEGFRETQMKKPRLWLSLRGDGTRVNAGNI